MIIFEVPGIITMWCAIATQKRLDTNAYVMLFTKGGKLSFLQFILSISLVILVDPCSR